MKKYLLIAVLVLLAGVLVIVVRNKKVAGSTVSINSETFQVMLANNEAERARGLSGREKLGADEGMLFLFDTASHNGFWMRDMKFPLDIIFILDDKVVGIYENLPPAKDEDPSPPVYGGEHVSNRVLEINAGLSKKYGIGVGDVVRYDLKN